MIKARRGEEAISSVSAPYLIAEMLGQAVEALGGLRDRAVLEIGSGGYNASLLRELVGPVGSVTTVDIDPQVTDRASACLARAGYNGDSFLQVLFDVLEDVGVCLLLPLGEVGPVCHVGRFGVGDVLVNLGDPANGDEAAFLLAGQF